MKFYNERTEPQLGYDRLRTLLTGRANTEEGKALCEKLKPFRSPGGIEVELTRVMECKELLESDETFSLEVRESMQEIFDEAGLPGNWLRATTLARFVKWLVMVRDVISYFRPRKERYPLLWSGISRLDWDKTLLEKLRRIVDDKGNIKDNASPALKNLRKQRMVLSSDLRRQLNSIMRHASQQGWTEATEITIRNDRYVIPLIADFKGRIKGFVHDVSQSGRTIFVEPSSVLEANNRIREVLLEEKNEVVRILTEATSWIGEEVDNLRDYAKSIARLDFIRAKARFALNTKSTKPKFDPKGKTYQILQGRHPLLMLKEGMSYDKVIPLTIGMTPEGRIILISGPNAGGKSVSLKTIGLFQLMLQSGLLVPCNPESEFRWFERLFIDIGDEQSIQTDLSTYTSHLANMQVMLKHLDKTSLFLIDEFGSGTDPRLGGAIAEAFLERFMKAHAYGVITTHYGNLKNFADNHDGIRNAAMQFDPRSLSPTYTIETGVPGRSYAFEIATNVGIPEDILAEAREKVDGKQIYSEELLLKLEAQKAELEAVLKEQKKNNEDLKHWLKRNQEMNKMIKEQEARIMREAHRNADGLIKEANAKIERTIKEIREVQADREKTKELRRDLREMLPEPPPPEEDEVLVEEQPKEARPEVIKGEPIKKGDWVQMRSSHSVGTVMEIQGKRAVVAFGAMRATVKLNQLDKIKAPKASKISSGGYTHVTTTRATVSTELHVKGFRVEQALPVVSKFIDDAIMANLKELKILHGKGTGALRLAIRDYLSSVPEVSKLMDAPLNAGGEGWTIVNLN